MTYLQVGDNPGKLGLIPHNVFGLSSKHQSLRALGEGLAAYQVVGRVMAYQADDG